MSNETGTNDREVRTIQPEQGIWRTYDGTDGLTFGRKNCLLQDRHGYLWLGTRNGLCRYDGINLITYTTEDGLVGNTARSICEDSQGCLWFGTQISGVSRYGGGIFTNYTSGIRGPGFPYGIRRSGGVIFRWCHRSGERSRGYV
jgi:ligand-binding sensor domain-containing protein